MKLKINISCFLLFLSFIDQYAWAFLEIPKTYFFSPGKIDSMKVLFFHLYKCYINSNIL